MILVILAGFVAAAYGASKYRNMFIEITTVTV